MFMADRYPPSKRMTARITLATWLEAPKAGSCRVSTFSPTRMMRPGTAATSAAEDAPARA